MSTATVAPELLVQLTTFCDHDRVVQQAERFLETRALNAADMPWEIV